jgi:hypothetical protein
MSVSLVDRIRTSLAAAEAAAAVAGEASCSSKAWRSVLQVGHVRCTGGSCAAFPPTASMCMPA